jgi:hypothetical protein
VGDPAACIKRLSADYKAVVLERAGLIDLDRERLTRVGLSVLIISFAAARTRAAEASNDGIDRRAHLMTTGVAVRSVRSSRRLVIMGRCCSGGDGLGSGLLLPSSLS